MKSLDSMRRWEPPSTWGRITVLDVHTAGEPLRIVTGGFPSLQGDTILARRRFLKEQCDRLRTSLLWEPRGHREMYGCVLTPPVTPGADFGILFMHNEGYSSMCGHGIIAVATAAVGTGMVPVSEPETAVTIDTPAGVVAAAVAVWGGKVAGVRFRNVPSFVVATDQQIEVAGVGSIRYDLAFGGAFYAYVDAAQLGLRCVAGEVGLLVEKGMAIKRALMTSRTIEHPSEPELGFLYGTIFIAPPLGREADSRNACVFADGQVDRSPTGTGVSGRMALSYARGEIGVGQPMVIESIIGTRFTGRVIRPTTLGPYQAVITEVEGSAHITGRHELLFDPDDQLRHGFLL